MADRKALYSTLVAVLGFVCFVVGAIAVGLPMWGYFQTASGGPGAEKGYFGPWKTCKELLFNRERCGKDQTKFRPTVAVWVSGIVACCCVAVLGVFCILSVLQLAMTTSKETVVMKYSTAVFSKLALGLLATLLSVASAGLFAIQGEDREFEISRGPGFYIQVLLILLTAGLFVMSLYDVLFARRSGGDPTKPNMPPETATTYGNPSYRDQGRGGISMTDASGRPYAGRASAAVNGSMASMDTTMTTASSNGSTAASSITRSPLRSSLKKPRQKDGMGIQNPGFSGTSPTLSRNGSVKKVRIQTHSTEV